MSTPNLEPVKGNAQTEYSRGTDTVLPKPLRDNYLN